MEGNKDEAKKCADLGQAAFESGDTLRALKWLGKAQKLYPTKEVADLLLKVAKSTKEPEPEASSSPSSSNIHRRRNRSQEHSDDGTGTARHANGAPNGMGGSGGGLPPRRASSAGNVRQEMPANVTAEMVEVVRRIQRTSNYYEMLSLEKTCTEEDVKKAYRKVALKLHPDKNKAPGAEEAFKAVSKAFRCLSDEDLRANYDRFGHEDPAAMQQQRRGAARAAAYQQDFDPNEIFNSFFFGGSPSSRVFHHNFYHSAGHVPRRQAPSHQAQDRSSPGNMLQLLQLLPLLALFLFTLMPASEPVFRLNRTEKHMVEKKTTNLGVPYYVQNVKFETEYPPESRHRRKLERQVEREYRDHLETKCYYERVQQQQIYRWDSAAKARAFAMPACDELRRMQQTVY